LLRELNVGCEVVAPSSIPRRSGDRVKNDRIDARKLATLYAAGLLTAVAFRGGSNWSQNYWQWLARIQLGATDQTVLDAYVDLVH